MTPQQFKLCQAKRALEPLEFSNIKQSPEEDHGFANTTSDSDTLNDFRPKVEINSTFEPVESSANVDISTQDAVHEPLHTQAKQLRGDIIDDVAHGDAYDQTALGKTGGYDAKTGHEQNIVAGEVGEDREDGEASGRMNADVCPQVDLSWVSVAGRHAQSHPKSPSDISDNGLELEESTSEPTYLVKTRMSLIRDGTSSLKRQLHTYSDHPSCGKEVLNNDRTPLESDYYNSTVTNKRVRYDSDRELHAQRQSESYNNNIDSLFYEQPDIPVANPPAEHSHYDHRMQHRRNSNAGSEDDETMINQNQTSFPPSHNHSATVPHGRKSNIRDEDDKSVIGQDRRLFFPSDNHYSPATHGRNSAPGEEDESTIGQDQSPLISPGNHPNFETREKKDESTVGRGRTSSLPPWNQRSSNIRYEDNESMVGEDQTNFLPSQHHRISNTRDEDDEPTIGQDQKPFLPSRNHPDCNNRYEDDESMMGQDETPFLPPRDYHTTMSQAPYSVMGPPRSELGEDDTGYTPFGRNPPRAARRVQSYAEEYNEDEEDEEFFLEKPVKGSSGIGRGIGTAKKSRSQKGPVNSPLSQSEHTVRVRGNRPSIGIPQLGVNSRHPDPDFFEDDPEIRSQESTPRVPTGRHAGFHVPGVLGSNLAPRDSGYKINKTSVNLPPNRDMAPQDTFSDASLIKRGITRTGAPTISRRAHGANDPENIRIVNMVENENVSWAAIADTLNRNRILTGRNPTFTANSVHNRYNRNAPLLFAAEGREWTSIKKRNSTTTSRAVPTSWTPELDLVLIETVQAVDKTRWGRVAAEFNNRTGQDIDAESAALRHRLI